MYQIFRGNFLSEKQQHRYKQLLDALRANDQIIRDDSKVAWDYIIKAKRTLEESVYLIKKGHVLYDHTAYPKILDYLQSLYGTRTARQDEAKDVALKLFNHRLNTQKTSVCNLCDLCKEPKFEWNLSGKDYWRQTTHGLGYYEISIDIPPQKEVTQTTQKLDGKVWLDSRSLCGNGKKGRINLAKILPIEVAERMLNMMDFAEILAISKVNQGFRRLILNDSFWKQWALKSPNEIRANLWLKAKKLTIDNSGLDFELPIKIHILGKYRFCCKCQVGDGEMVCENCVVSHLNTRKRFDFLRICHTLIKVKGAREHKLLYRKRDVIKYLM